MNNLFETEVLTMEKQRELIAEADQRRMAKKAVTGQTTTFSLIGFIRRVFRRPMQAQERVRQMPAIKAH